MAEIHGSDECYEKMLENVEKAKNLGIDFNPDNLTIKFEGIKVSKELDVEAMMHSSNPFETLYDFISHQNVTSSEKIIEVVRLVMTIYSQK